MNNFESKWAIKTAKRIVNGTLTEAEANKMRSLLAQAINRTRLCGGATHCTAHEARELVELLNEHPVRVATAQARKGARWLYQVTFKPNGEPRGEEFYLHADRYFRERDHAVIRELASNPDPEFWLIGLESIEDRGFVSFLPIYRAVSEAGKITYMVRAWQSGGYCEVLSHA